MVVLVLDLGDQGMVLVAMVEGLVLVAMVEGLVLVAMGLEAIVEAMAKVVEAKVHLDLE